MAMWTWSNDYNKEITKSGNNVKEEGTAGAVPFLILKFGVGVPFLIKSVDCPTPARLKCNSNSICCIRMVFGSIFYSCYCCIFCI